MNGAIFAYSRQGCQTAKGVMEALTEVSWEAYTMERFSQPDFRPLGKGSDFYGGIFHRVSAMVFVGSCGIAVRQIAPWVRDKRTDPAVLCVDELGHFVIPLLSGHIGGANQLALALAEVLQATPVITTATDINRKFSVDAWAARNGFAIDDMKLAKAVSAEILERKVPFYSDFPVVSAYPGGVEQGKEGDLGICVSYCQKEPFSRTLRLIPKVLHLGIGCRKGTTREIIASAVKAVLQQHGIDQRAIKCIASIDLKAEETGLLAYCEGCGIAPQFYTAQQLREVPGDFTPSAFVQSITGVDNVCERAALLGAEELIVRKTAMGGVTVAVAAEKLEVRFG